MNRLLCGLAACAFGIVPSPGLTQGTPRVPNLFLVDGFSAPTASGNFEETRIHFIGSSAAGMTTRQYLRSEAWDALLKRVQRGDFVILDFPADTLSARAQDDAKRTLGGFGDGTFDYLDPGTHQVELVHSYGWYLRKMVVEVLNQGAKPLLCGVPRGVRETGAGDWARVIATEQRIVFVPVDPEGAGLVDGLRGLAADPLAPYLKEVGSVTSPTT